MKNELLKKLNEKYTTSGFTALANEGRFAEAATMAAKYGMWGVWAECREAGGLPNDDDTRNAVVAEIMAAKKAAFGGKK